jgi:hypothetical protein
MTSLSENPSGKLSSETAAISRIIGWFFPHGSRHGWRRLHWSRLTGALFALALLAYVTLAAAAFGFVRYHRGIEAVHFVDILLPWRWENYRIARGDQQFLLARWYAEQGMPREAVLFARTGLAKSPANRDGRLLLAEMMTAIRRPDEAHGILVEGLRHHAADPAFLRPLLTFLLQQQDDTRIVALAARLLPETVPGSEAAHWLALGAATASYHRGSYDGAEDFLRAVPKLVVSRDGRLLSAKIDWDRGHRDLALVQLRGLVADFPHDAELHRELIRYLRQRGLLDEARRYGVSFQIAFSAQPGPRIELLHAYGETEGPARVRREVETLLMDFGADQAALLALGEYAANAGNVALVRRIGRQAAERGLAPDAFALLTVEAQVVAHDYVGALDAIRGYRTDFPAWERQRGLLESLQAAALFGRGDETAAAMYLGNLLAQPNLRADHLLAVANRLAEIGAGEHARKTLVRATEIDPLNQAALTRLVELDIILNAGDDLAAHVQRLVRMRRPSPDILRVAQLKLGSDLFLHSRTRPAALEAVRLALEHADDSARRL